jgi:NADH:ubiquinone oxidoreductase subunit D
VLRGSGVDQDMRRDGEAIYTAMYDGYAFEVAVMKDGHYPRDHEYPPVPADAVLGDCWHRFFVRMLEVVQSMDLVRQAIDRYSACKGTIGEPVKLTEKILPRERRLRDPVAGSRPVELVLEPRRRPGALPGLPDRRRAGDRGQPRHRDGRDRPVDAGLTRRFFLGASDR